MEETSLTSGDEVKLVESCRNQHTPSAMGGVTQPGDRSWQACFCGQVSLNPTCIFLGERAVTDSGQHSLFAVLLLCFSSQG